MESDRVNNKFGDGGRAYSFCRGSGWQKLKTVIIGSSIAPADVEAWRGLSTEE
jgi:hypothetical protein